MKMIITWSVFLLLLLGQSTQVMANLSANRLVIVNEGTIGSCPGLKRGENYEDTFQLPFKNTQ